MSSAPAPAPAAPAAVPAAPTPAAPAVAAAAAAAPPPAAPAASKPAAAAVPAKLAEAGPSKPAAVAAPTAAPADGKENKKEQPAAVSAVAATPAVGRSPGPPQQQMAGMDFVDDIDPSFVDGHRLVYDREVPFELRSLEGTVADPSSEIGSLEAIRVKILVNGDDKHVTNMRLELCSESNLFFHYVHALDEKRYREFQDWQRLTCEYRDYPRVLMRMLDYCIQHPHSHLAVFVMQRDGTARLDFIQNMEYKFVEMLSCDFVASPEELVRQQVNYRYASLKSRLAVMQARLADVHGLMHPRGGGRAGFGGPQQHGHTAGPSGYGQPHTSHQHAGYGGHGRDVGGTFGGALFPPGGGVGAAGLSRTSAGGHGGGSNIGGVYGGGSYGVDRLRTGGAASTYRQY